MKTRRNIILAGLIVLPIVAAGCAVTDRGSGAQGSSGTWFGNVHTDAGGTPDAPAGSHSREMMNRAEPQASAGSSLPGTWYRGIHTDAGGTPDAPPASHSRQTMEKQPRLPQGQRGTEVDRGLPNY
jgi:hypothetical protein